jgi:imidazolonepropionase-like amidohydrolase
MNKRLTTFCLLLSAVLASVALAQQQSQPARVTAIKAGRLIDPETGTASANVVILVEGEKIKDVGPNLAIPAGAAVIDLGSLTVLPGLVDAHTHMAITYKEQPENNYYYLTYVMDSTALRAIQAASNAIQILNSGFTIVRDVGNNALYADAALRQAIEQGWLPGPTVIPSGPIIGSTGGQFWPTPEMYRQHNIMFPEYIDANSPDEIVRAIRENMLFGARTIKLCIDCKPWGYSVEDIKLAISEAAKAAAKSKATCKLPKAHSARSTQASTSSLTGTRSPPSIIDRWRRRESFSPEPTHPSPTTAALKRLSNARSTICETRGRRKCPSHSPPISTIGTSA